MADEEETGKHLKGGVIYCPECLKSSNKKAQYEVEIYKCVSSREDNTPSDQSHEIQRFTMCLPCSRNLLTQSEPWVCCKSPSSGDATCVTVNVFDVARSRQNWAALHEHMLDMSPMLNESYFLFHECKKNPGHENFTPVKDFGLQSLPEGVQIEDIYQCIREMIPLTVKLVMSPRNESAQTGSGSLYISKNIPVYVSCPCRQCLASPGTHPVFECVWITTALHVVRNDEQAKETVVVVDYDDDDCPVIELQGHRLVNTDENADRCILECFAHCVGIYDRVLKTREKVRVLEQRLKEMFKDNCPNLAVVISHPHGMPKMVSFGEITEKIVVDNPCKDVQKTSFKHNAPTCPGSSGAVLWVLGFERIGYMDMGITDHTHSKGAEGNANESGQGLESDFPKIQGIIVHNHINCSHLAQYEVEIYKCVSSSRDDPTPSDQSHEIQRISMCWPCSRHLLTQGDPGGVYREDSSFGDNTIVTVKLFDIARSRHRNFTRVRDFILQSLPEEVQYEDIYQCIKGMIPLAVKLEMNLKENSVKAGSGSLYISNDIPKYEKCPCLQCQDRQTAHPESECLWITTALHVVENDEQARATKVIVDYDDDDCQVIVLQGHRLVNKDAQADRCILECFAHCSGLKDRVFKTRENVQVLENKLKTTFKDNCPNLGVIISHPHGMPKMVSFGKITEKIVVDNPCKDVQKTSFKHNVPTCQGSSGAVLWVLGFERIGYMDMGITDHTHSKGLTGNANESGQGLEKDFPNIQGIVAETRRLVSVKPLTHDSVKPLTDDSVKPLTHDSVKPLTHDSVKPLTHDSVKPLTHDSLTPLTHDSFTPLTHDSVKPLTHDSVKPLTHDFVKPLTHDSVKPLTHDSVKPLTHDSLTPLTHDSFTPLTHDSVKPLTHDSVKPLTHDSVKPLTHDSVKPLTHDSVKPLTHDSVTPFTHDSVKPLTHDSVKPLTHDSVKSLTHDSVKPLTHDSVKSLTHDYVKPLTHDSVNPLTHDSVKTLTHDSVKPLTHDSVKPLTHDSVKPLTHDSVTPFTHDSVKPLTHDSVKPLTHDSVKSLAHDSVKPLTHDSVKSLTHDYVKPLTHDSVNPLTHDSVKSLTHDSVKPLTHDSVKPLTHDSVKPLTHDSVKPLTHDSVKPLTHDSVTPFTHDSVKPLTHDSVKPLTHDSVKSFTHDSVKPLTHDSVKPLTHDYVKPLTHDSVNPMTHDSVKSLTHDSVKPLTHDSVKPLTHNSVKPLTHDSVKPLTHDSVTPLTHDSVKPLTHDSVTPLTHDFVTPLTHDSVKP
ncbi:hypothetical protein Btru_041155 [Bulinus truncatus]|nr:hypothetical protein Btru_041155 [Bulinus truncatus]